ncbi:hypothetical protein OAV88_00050 [bacterium]|nr:hypothetical protein [bacterium]
MSFCHAAASCETLCERVWTCVNIHYVCSTYVPSAGLDGCVIYICVYVAYVVVHDSHDVVVPPLNPIIFFPSS